MDPFEVVKFCKEAMCLCCSSRPAYNVCNVESDTPATPEELGLRSSLTRNFPAPLVVDVLMLSRLPSSGGEWTCLQEVTVPNPARLSQEQTFAQQATKITVPSYHAPLWLCHITC
ncbi:hypothetical protein FOPG_00191 [Fusarium oxysporum f. sp. conglutinans race 2 54008]|uniref:Uncharacterized protein n=1 Tax=Fusarium oxysporum f. sp. conglutinans race 2 54008 TaxID=1089457 RepID=X0IKZ2_FUSOX|nr:hypothetical protein FOPG_00191 [Fusarium oxysporum f. sp. conglutinans race 2 54008]KAJ0154840.1 Uncharacterized protein HZ326_2831 [Fusarium oxysporum f. sp. albedinis]